MPLTAKVMTIQLGRCVTPNPLRFPSGLISMFAQHSNLVCRPFSIWGRAAWRKTGRRSRANLTRKRVFGGAWPPSSPVRRSTPARPCLLARAERVLFERAAGPYARCPSSLAVIPAVIDIYASRCARGCAARGLRGSGRGAWSRGVCPCACVSGSAKKYARPVAELGCT